MEPHRNHVNCKAASQAMAASCAAAPVEPHGTPQEPRGSHVNGLVAEAFAAVGTTWNHTGTT